MSNTPLKPCPFCGYKKPLAHQRDVGGWSIICPNCSASNSYNPVKSARRDEAASLWNTRAPDPKLSEAMELIGEMHQALAEAQEWNWIDDVPPPMKILQSCQKTEDRAQSFLADQPNDEGRETTPRDCEEYQITNGHCCPNGSVCPVLEGKK